MSRFSALLRISPAKTRDMEGWKGKDRQTNGPRLRVRRHGGEGTAYPPESGRGYERVGGDPHRPGDGDF